MWSTPDSADVGLEQLSDESYGSSPYTLGKFDPDDPEDSEQTCVIKRKNLGPADIGLLAAWLAVESVSKQLTALDSECDNHRGIPATHVAFHLTNATVVVTRSIGK